MDSERSPTSNTSRQRGRSRSSATRPASRCGYSPELGGSTRHSVRKWLRTGESKINICPLVAITFAGGGGSTQLGGHRALPRDEATPHPYLQPRREIETCTRRRASQDRIEIDASTVTSVWLPASSVSATSLLRLLAVAPAGGCNPCRPIRPSVHHVAPLCLGAPEGLGIGRRG